MLWTELKDMFTFSEGVNEELVKQCASKKMALAFATLKKSCSPITSRRIRNRTGTIFLKLNLTGRSSNSTSYLRKHK